VLGLLAARLLLLSLITVNNDLFLAFLSFASFSSISIYDDDEKGERVRVGERESAE
jgi:hypothetical protein